MPFPILGIDSDNGSEFINHHLLAWCQQRKLTFTRSRPGNSNDPVVATTPWAPGPLLRMATPLMHRQIRIIFTTDLERLKACLKGPRPNASS